MTSDRAQARRVALRHCANAEYLEVDNALEAGTFDFEPILKNAAAALQGDAVVMSLRYAAGNNEPTRGQEKAIRPWSHHAARIRGCEGG